jgi:hypothetical protein
MILSRLFILIITTVLFRVCAGAQDTGFVYRDPSIVGVDSIAAKLSETGEQAENTDEEAVEEEGVIYIDTSLQPNGLAVQPDSMKTLKSQSALAYAKNLDSVLADHQRKQKAKAAKVSDKPSWLERFFLSGATMYFFWALAITFILFILYKLFFAEGFFQRTYKRAPVTIMGDEEGNLAQSTDFSNLISQAIQLKNYRLAVRYYYLQTLQKLSAKGHIEFAPDKTNHEYVLELAGKKFKNEFAALTLHYEYAWYGEFEITEQAFSAVQQKFKQFNTGLY